MDLLSSVKARVSQRYPEMSDVDPSAVEATDKVTIFMFHKELKGEDGTMFPKIIRVTVENATGAILKLVVSKTGPRP